jgi:hypothetical protein
MEGSQSKRQFLHKQNRDAVFEMTDVVAGSR